MRKYLNFLIFMLLVIMPSLNWANTSENTIVQVNLVNEEETIQPGRPFWVAIHFKIKEGWHTYWKNPGDVGVPLNIKWQVPENFEVVEVKWPTPEKFITSEMMGFGYADEFVLLSQITSNEDLAIDTTQTLTLKADWLACSSTMCQPGAATVNLNIEVKNQPPVIQPDFLSLFEHARQALPQLQDDIIVKRIKNNLELKIPESADHIQSAFFFPEEQQVIDYTHESFVQHSDEQSNCCRLDLKEKKSAQALKGILVLTTQANQTKSVTIDNPIIDDNFSDLISFADEQKFGPAPLQEATEDKHEFEGGFAWALLLAFVGGMILNLMPCVLPIISLKVMSFVKMAGKKRSLTIQHGLWFSLGVLISFWILVAAIFILRAYGQVVGWGFQLQEPIFVVVLASLFFIFALSLFGLFEWGLIFSSWAGQTQADTTKNSSDSFVGSFFSGILATAVATPCTGPFLGSALGFALTLPPLKALIIFTSLGLGMCFPYLLLAAFPSLLRFVPKPGAWMETFKQLTGFILLAAVVWLMWVFSAQTNSFSLICLVAGFLCFAFGAWIYGRGGVPSAGKTKRIISYCLLAVSFFVGYQIIVLPRATWHVPQESGLVASAAGWEPFSIERIAQLRAEGKPVLIDFTAKWCLICQLNHFVLDSKEINKKMANLGVVKMKADWTSNDPIITQELSKFGRNSVPLYVVYGTEQDEEPLILPQVLTPDIVASHLDQAIKQNVAMSP